MAEIARARAAGSSWTGLLDYALPPELIAQAPARERTGSRLMVVDRATNHVDDHHFIDLPSFLRAGDLLVANDSAVFQARLAARKPTGGAAEILLLALSGRDAGDGVPAMVRASKAVREGQRLVLADGSGCRVGRSLDGGRFEVSFEGDDAAGVAGRLGSVPLPPYIERREGPSAEDRERYQTVYARERGSVAAPTAGLHFTPELLAALGAAGVEVDFVTLHVGPGTFTPVRGALDEHRMEAERCRVSAEVGRRIEQARERGGRVIAVGTTTVRALEAAARETGGAGGAWEGETNLFIRPGHRFAAVDALITNFHLPASTLLCLVMALAGEDLLRDAYEHAVRERYRFYSYGDAMLIV